MPPASPRSRFSWRAGVAADLQSDRRRQAAYGSRGPDKTGDSQICNLDVDGVGSRSWRFCPEMNNYGWAAWIEPAVEK